MRIQGHGALQPGYGALRQRLVIVIPRPTLRPEDFSNRVGRREILRLDAECLFQRYPSLREIFPLPGRLGPLQPDIFVCFAPSLPAQIGCRPQEHQPGERFAPPPQP